MTKTFNLLKLIRKSNQIPKKMIKKMLKIIGIIDHVILNIQKKKLVVKNTLMR